MKRGNAIRLNADTKKWLYPNGFYTVARRFSAKEERRRIVASVVTPAAFPRRRPLRDLYSVDTKPNEGKADRDWTVRTGLSSTVTQRLMISVTPMRRLAQFAGVNMTNMTSRLRHRFLGLHNQAWHGGNVLAAKGRSRFRIHED